MVTDTVPVEREVATQISASPELVPLASAILFHVNDGVDVTVLFCNAVSQAVVNTNRVLDTVPLKVLVVLVVPLTPTNAFTANGEFVTTTGGITGGFVPAT